MKKETMLSAAMLSAVALIAAVPPVLAQVPVAMVDCVVGGPCIGTPGNDTITGSAGQDTIYALEGDDIIDPGNDTVTDYVYCGPGFDTVNQMPRPLPDGAQDLLHYEPSPDVIADDCEERAL